MSYDWEKEVMSGHLEGVVIQDSIDHSKPMIVSFSEVFKWQTCQRQYYYRFDLGLAPIEESDAIRTGVIGHRLLQSFHEMIREGKNKEESHEIVRKQAKKILDESSVTNFGNLVKAWTLVDNYIRDTDFASEAVLVENRFLLPVSHLIGPALAESYGLSDVQIGFTPDVVFERTGKKFDVEDYKFVARAWSGSKLNRFPQTKLYQIFLECMGYEISRSVLRFFNVTTGKINDQNYTLTDTARQILIKDFISGVREVVKYRTNSYREPARTMNYTACQFCSWEYVCSLQAEGKDATYTIETQFKKSEYDYNS